MSGTHVKYLIIGSGPTGLGAAHRLKELGENDFMVLEANAYPGGLAASFKDEAGFTWDIGGHVVFAHYPYFDQLIDEMLGADYLTHKRIAAVRMLGAWGPYPFQNNLRHLPKEVQWDCVAGLLPGKRPTAAPTNFAEWIMAVFGEGLARHFMNPYNFKVWATPPELMAYAWIGERVSIVDLEGVLKNLILGEDNITWGPNNMFRFPLNGGTGEIFRRLAASLGERVRLNTPAARIDPVARRLETAQGQVYEYDYLLSTAPLDILIRDVLQCPESALRAAAADLLHNSVYVSGIGVNAARPDETCWMYFPEDNCPFYRVTNFHNYSPGNVPRPGHSRALMAETSYSQHKPENLAGLTQSTIDGLVNTALLTPEEAQSAIASTWSFTADYGYPVPSLGRDKALALLQPWLEERRIYSRGRFGGWRYEVSNMDHSVMQGVEWAERMVSGKPESTYQIPNLTPERV